MNQPLDEELKQLEREMREPLSANILKPPSTEETNQLIRSLQREFNNLREPIQPEVMATLNFNPRVEPPTLYTLLRGQLRLNLKWLMSTGAAVFIMLVLVTEPQEMRGSDPWERWTMNIFPMITPLMLILSLLFSIRIRGRGMKAVETITPYPPTLLIFSRMILVMSFIIGWAVVSTFIIAIRLAIAGKGILPIGSFVLDWLGISLLTGGTAMYMMFRQGFKTAMLVSTMVYGIWVMIQIYMPDPTNHVAELFHIILTLIGITLISLSYRWSLGVYHVMKTGDDL